MCMHEEWEILGLILWACVCRRKWRWQQKISQKPSDPEPQRKTQKNIMDAGESRSAGVWNEPVKCSLAEQKTLPFENKQLLTASVCICICTFVYTYIMTALWWHVLHNWALKIYFLWDFESVLITRGRLIRFNSERVRQITVLYAGNWSALIRDPD